MLPTSLLSGVCAERRAGRACLRKDGWLPLMTCALCFSPSSEAIIGLMMALPNA
jgi:hypothetical protein